MTNDETRAFVPIERAALDELDRTVARAAQTAIVQRAAVARLLELADDFRLDAVRRLAERGATEAQVQGYEAAFGAERVRLLEAGAERDAVLAEIGRIVQELAEV